MRSDMAKVLSESARLRTGVRRPKGRKRRMQRYDMEDLPRTEGMRLHWLIARQQKPLAEKLASMGRFLRSRVGRPWDDVFSEICSHSRLDSSAQRIVRDYLESFVALHVEIIGHKVCLKNRRVHEPIEPRQPFYVHPDNGLLLVIPRRSRKELRREIVAFWWADAADEIRVGGRRRRIEHRTNLRRLPRFRQRRA